MSLKSGLKAAVALTALGLALPAYAQEAVELDVIVVTPNRAPTEANKVGSKVEVITGEEIAAQSKPLLIDYLDLIPGLNVSPSGGRGQETSLSIRGADKKYVKTLFNGIDIADPTATQNQTSYEHLLPQGVSGIEVLKGSQGTLYGADAVAGVIGISTLGGIPLGIHHEITGEGGSYGTARGGYSLTGASETGRAAATIQGLHTDGISAAASGSEDDRYRNGTGTFAFEQQVSENFGVFGSGLFIRSEAEFDDSGNPPVDNPFNEGDSRQAAGRIGFNADFLDGRFKNTVSAQIYDIDRDLLQVSSFGPFEANYQGQRRKADYQGAFEFNPMATLQFGADHEVQTADVTDNFDTDTSDDLSLTGVWTQGLFEPIPDLTLAAGVRHDEHSEFGGYTTYRLTGAYLFAGSGTKLHSSFGTGFRAPSLYELYAPFAGNTDLDPEESQSFDIGVEQSFFGGRLTADATFFLLDTENLIDYDFSTFRYEQLPGTTERRGVELSARYAATEWLDLGASYTYTKTEQPDGLRRPRIPEHDIGIVAIARPAERWEVSGTVRAALDVQDRIAVTDADFNTVFQDVGLDDYLLLDAKLAYKPTENTEVYVRGENLLDQDYEVVKGYGTPGASVFAGFKARF